MSDATANLKAMDLDQVCRLVETLADSISNAEMSHLILELARRARVMDQHLSPKPEPEDEKMPYAILVWIGSNGLAWDACARTQTPTDKEDWKEIYGPYELVPGMMSLDELAAYKISLSTSNHIWRVWQEGVRSHTMYGTALEAQWAATQLAKKGKE